MNASRWIPLFVTFSVSFIQSWVFICLWSFSSFSLLASFLHSGPINFAVPQGSSCPRLLSLQIFHRRSWQTPPMCSRIPNFHVKLQMPLLNSFGYLSLNSCLVPQTIMYKTELISSLLLNLSLKQCVLSIVKGTIIYHFLNQNLEIRYICRLSPNPVWFTFIIL